MNVASRLGLFPVLSRSKQLPKLGPEISPSSPLFFSAPLGPETKPHNLVPTVKIYCPDSFFESDLKNLSSLFQKMKIFFVQSALKFLHCSALVR